MKLRSAVRSPVSPSSVACGATFPLEGEGCYGWFIKHRDSADLQARWEVEHKKLRSAAEAFPFEGEGGAAGDG